ncbi:hypothetical protein [Paraburkholderia franconis]|uniref:hypothetical protein n=1 Tax=Paraburkholderia franconis TaxID=2654983 RepID=UPI00187B202E|nr:hypothetical protein [Paraburkholderia franconis]
MLHYLLKSNAKRRNYERFPLVRSWPFHRLLVVWSIVARAIGVAALAPYISRIH